MINSIVLVVSRIRAEFFIGIKKIVENPMKYVSLGFLLFAQGAEAQSGENYIVHGYSVEDINTEVSRIFKPRFESDLAEWRSKLCIDVFGLTPQFTHLFSGLLVKKFNYFNLESSSSCIDKNVFVFFTDQSDRLAAEVESKNPNLFVGYEASPVYQSNFDGPSESIQREFLRSRAIRWLVSTAKENRESIPPLVLPSSFGPSYFSQSYDPSLVISPTRKDIHLSILIIDIERIKNAKWVDLSDVVSMIIMSAPILGESYSSITFLKQTNEKNIPNLSLHLTDFDQLLLKNLYDLRPGEDARSAVGYISERIWQETSRQKRPEGNIQEN
ncbi:hypothetical protein [Brytella acorum]|uniref:hypothetical protein n=1 Tax=Brytella acorum TaxID=2959299 RepID=UPI0025AE568E|nr:hypothetical protein [Brytella acorum]MDF3626204.1 hypothetical protein [Brytella acorum]